MIDWFYQLGWIRSFGLSPRVSHMLCGLTFWDNHHDCWAPQYRIKKASLSTLALVNGTIGLRQTQLAWSLQKDRRRLFQAFPLSQQFVWGHFLRHRLCQGLAAVLLADLAVVTSGKLHATHEPFLRQPFSWRTGYSEPSCTLSVAWCAGHQRVSSKGSQWTFPRVALWCPCGSSLVWLSCRELSRRGHQVRFSLAGKHSAFAYFCSGFDTACQRSVGRQLGFRHLCYRYSSS